MALLFALQVKYKKKVCKYRSSALYANLTYIILNDDAQLLMIVML